MYRGDVSHVHLEVVCAQAYTIKDTLQATERSREVRPNEATRQAMSVMESLWSLTVRNIILGAGHCGPAQSRITRPDIPYLTVHLTQYC